MNTRLRNDLNYVSLHAKDNQNCSNLNLQNYRTFKFTKNPNYIYKTPYFWMHKFRDIQAIDDGEGPSGDKHRHVDIDSDLIHSNWEVKPDDKLASKSNFIRQIDFLPYGYINEFTNPINRSFLITTSISDNPQQNFQPDFKSSAVSSRNYNRWSDEYYRKKGNKSNHFRKQSMYYRVSS